MAEGRTNGELLFNEYGVSIWNDEKFWKWIVVMVHSNVNVFNAIDCTLNMAKIVNFMLCI